MKEEWGYVGNMGMQKDLRKETDLINDLGGLLDG
jgi:hypothetical protein